MLSWTGAAVARTTVAATALLRTRVVQCRLVVREGSWIEHGQALEIQIKYEYSGFI